MAAFHGAAREETDFFMLRAVIFDFDGTLADTIPAITEGVNLTMRQYGFPTHSEAEVRTFINNGPRMLIRRALPRELQENECLLDRVLTDYDRLYRTVCLHTDTPYDGINALIDRLRERGVRIGVLSNKQDHLLRKICTGMFGDRIDCIVGTVPDRPTKPDPYLAKKLAEYGNPMNVMSNLGDEWDWIKSPWPWEYEANV